MRYANAGIMQVWSIFERCGLPTLCWHVDSGLEESSGLTVLHRDLFLVDEVKLFRHQRSQLTPIVL